ncbi:PAAR domain-containing protein [Massilia sp. LXY-6]|uniref:PAAR domain-containing protein n=1 Tax=Massilia sp. LXY-6 TaxID=3379823 RepID=UPI003EE1D1B5
MTVMKRHHITLGAGTTADGVVTSATSLLSIDGRHMALEGDEIRCHTCGSTGLIQCIGPRLPEQFNGKQVALENDLCMCQCVPHPRLLPSQTQRYQYVDEAQSA